MKNIYEDECRRFKECMGGRVYVDTLDSAELVQFKSRPFTPEEFLKTGKHLGYKKQGKDWEINGGFYMEEKIGVHKDTAIDHRPRFGAYLEEGVITVSWMD